MKLIKSKTTYVKKIVKNAVVPIIDCFEETD